MSPSAPQREPSSTELAEAQDLARLSPLAREGLTRRLADPRGGGLMAQLGRADNLHRLLSSLTGEELYAAATLAFVNKASADRLHEHLALRISADGAVRAIDGLARIGLAIRGTYEPRQIWMLSTMQRALRPALSDVLAHEGHPPPLEGAEHDIAPRLFEDLALVAALAGFQPKVTQSGEIFKRDLLTLHAVFARRFHDPALLAEEIDLLSDLGLVAVGARLEVPAEAVAGWAALDRGEQLRRHAVARSRAVPTLAPLWQLLTLCESVPLLVLVELAELDASAEPVLWRRGRERRLDGPTRVDLLLLQPGVGLADVGRARLVGLTATLRKAMRGEPVHGSTEAVPPHLLPSMEAIVPPECPPVLFVDLGRFLELEAIDTVARLKLTRESVEAAARRGLSSETMLAHLHASAPHGMPDNVARAIRDFADPRPPGARWLEGPMVHVPELARAEQLKFDPEIAGMLRELSPGMFELIGPHAIAPVRRRLVALGMWRPQEQELQVVPRLAPWSDDAASNELRQLSPPSVKDRSPVFARRARAVVELTELGPQQAGASERLAKARAKLTTDPEAYAKFLAALPDDERAETQPRLERLLEPGAPIIDQLAVLDRVAPNWYLRLRPRRRKTTAG